MKKGVLPSFHPSYILLTHHVISKPYNKEDNDNGWDSKIDSKHSIIVSD